MPLTRSERPGLNNQLPGLRYPGRPSFYATSRAQACGDLPEAVKRARSRRPRQEVRIVQTFIFQPGDVEVYFVALSESVIVEAPEAFTFNPLLAIGILVQPKQWRATARNCQVLRRRAS